MTLWTVAHQDPLSLEFSRQEYWSRLPFPSLWDLPDPVVKNMPSNAGDLSSVPGRGIKIPASLMAQWVKNPVAMRETQETQV